MTRRLRETGRGRLCQVTTNMATVSGLKTKELCDSPVVTGKTVWTQETENWSSKYIFGCQNEKNTDPLLGTLAHLSLFPRSFLVRFSHFVAMRTLRVAPTPTGWWLPLRNGQLMVTLLRAALNALTQISLL